MMSVTRLRWKWRGGERRFRADEPFQTGETPMLPETTTSPYAVTLLRLTNGLALLAHGAVLKLGTFGLAGTMGYFGSIGYPPVLGAVVAFAETLAGLALLAGVGVRWVSLGALAILLGAVAQHAPNGWVFNAAGGGWEYPAFWAAALLAQAGLGAGALAVRLPMAGGLVRA
jgi:putative oxidoreductase